MTNGETVVDQKRVAKMCGVTESAVEKWRFLGRGPKFIGLTKRCVRYRISDVQAWLSERENVKQTRAVAMTLAEVARALDIDNTAILVEHELPLKDGTIGVGALRAWLKSEAIAYMATALNCPASRVSDLVG